MQYFMLSLAFGFLLGTTSGQAQQPITSKTRPCIFKTVATPAPTLACGLEGTVNKPDPVPGTTWMPDSPKACRNACYNDASCASWWEDTVNDQCLLMESSVSPDQVTRNDSSENFLWNTGCFVRNCCPYKNVPNQCGGICVNFSTDYNNCGACGHYCNPKVAHCVKGQCVCNVKGQVYCNQSQTCVPNVDACCKLYCNPKVAHCVKGQCVCNIKGQTYCEQSQTCFDLKADPNGCCKTYCNPDVASCVNGSCSCLKKGLTYCPKIRSCTDLRIDPKNCGACGNTCPKGACKAGVCV